MHIASEEETKINHTKILMIENWGSDGLVIQPESLGVTFFLFGKFTTEVVTDSKIVADRVRGYVKRVNLLSEDDFIKDLEKLKLCKDSDCIFITVSDKDLTRIAETVGKSVDELKAS